MGLYCIGLDKRSNINVPGQEKIGNFRFKSGR